MLRLFLAVGGDLSAETPSVAGSKHGDSTYHMKELKKRKNIRLFPWVNATSYHAVVCTSLSRRRTYGVHNVLPNNGTTVALRFGKTPINSVQ